MDASILDVTVSNVLAGLEDDEDFGEGEQSGETQGQAPQGITLDGEEVGDCVICFDNPPDAVFMKCGHGGVCYTCAMDIWKRNAECYLCRKEIAAVYQLSTQKGEYFEVIAETHRFEKEKAKSDSECSSLTSVSSVEYSDEEKGGGGTNSDKKPIIEKVQMSLDDDSMFERA